jgi:hypothetical protein
MCATVASGRVAALAGAIDVNAGDPSPRRPSEPDSYAPTVIAKLTDGPLEGTSIDAPVVQGRPPSIVEVPGDDGRTYRYCLAEWTQAGPSAVYTFLYSV